MSGLDGVPSRYLAAAIQFEPTLFEKERNIERLLALTEEAARAGAKLIVHPEMATTGYCWASREEIAQYVEPVPGPTTDAFGDLASRYGCHIVLSFPEVVPATGIFYNCGVLVGPRGVIGVYRKTHSYISEPKWAKDGDLGLPVFETELGKIAITICMDAAFPETTRVPALEGAEVICFPTNWLSEKSPSPSWIARAVESGVYFIAANRYGLERGVQFSGGSCVIDPDGTVQSSHDFGDGIAYGTIDPARARNKRWGTLSSEDKLADRRPDTYGAITLSAYRWQDRDFHGLYGINPLPEGKRSRISVCQLSPVPGDLGTNLAQIELFAAQNSGADLVVFPELAATGAVEDETTARQLANHADEIADRLTGMASSFGIHLIAGFVEEIDGRLYNAAVLVGSKGVLGTYQKLHLTAQDSAWATPGERLKTFDIPAGRVGILIGYDAAFPEATTCLGLQGADVIACPAMVDGPGVQPARETEVPLPPPAVTGPTDAHFHLWRERARESASVVMFANAGAPAMGWSGIFGATVEDEPADQVMLSGNEPGSVTYELDTTNLDTRYKTNPVRAKDILAMRMPIWYDALQRPVQTIRAGREAELLVSHGADD
jgi:predicted amidohydrolase